MGRDTPYVCAVIWENTQRARIIVATIIINYNIVLPDCTTDAK